MLRRLRAMLPPLVCLAAGCVPVDSTTTLVADNPFAGPLAAPAATRTAYAPAATDAAARVDTLGRSLLAANPQLGLQPLFRTIGSAEVELFHRGTSEINVTEGLVRRCKTDGALAAVLCMELGRMVSEREALASPRKRSQERDLPLEVAIGGDNGADRTRMAELLKYNEPDRRRSLAGPPVPPDPRVLARIYMTNAGFAPAELDAIMTLLHTAESSGKLERQLLAPGRPGRGPSEICARIGGNPPPVMHRGERRDVSPP